MFGWPSWNKEKRAQRKIQLLVSACMHPSMSSCFVSPAKKSLIKGLFRSYVVGVKVVMYH